MQETDKARMRWILFFVFVVLFLVLVVVTILSVFFGFGNLAPADRSLFTKVFAGEIGLAVIALFYSLFSLRAPSTESTETTFSGAAAMTPGTSSTATRTNAEGSVSSSGFMTTEMLGRLLAEARHRFWIIGIKNSRLANLQAEILRGLHEYSSLEIRILSLDWRAPKIVLDSYRQCVQTPGQSFPHTIESHHELFTGNRASYGRDWGTRFSIRAYAEFPVYPMVITDDRVFLGLYVHNVPEKELSTYNSPYVEVAQSAALGSLAMSQFESVWRRSRCICRTDEARWIIFDLDNTLYDSPAMRSAYEKHAFELFQSCANENRGTAREQWDRRKDELSKELGYSPPPREVLRSLNVPPEYWGIVTQKIDPRRYLQPDPDLQELFGKLSCARKIALLTNNIPFQAEATLEALSIRSYFDQIICADEFGGLKPDNVVFTGALQKIAARPEDSTMIGDNEAVDLFPAKAVGMNTIQTNRANLSPILNGL